ncbi:MAG: RNA polymerase sigma factor [Roseburia sp.]
MTQEDFIKLIEQEGASIYAFCCHLTGKREEADELYQNTMLTAIEKRRKLDLLEHPKSYLMAIAVRHWKNEKRKYARRERIAPRENLMEEESIEFFPGMEPSPEQIFFSEERCRLVRMEIEALKEQYRIPVYLYYFAELGIEEIANILHLPNGTIKSRLHKARVMIRERMEEHGYEI